MNNVFILFSLFIFNSQLNAFDSQSTKEQSLEFSKEENVIFDKNKTTAINLLKTSFDSSKVLFIGLYHHYAHQHINQLTELVQSIAKDKRLKYIVLERFGDNSKFYEALSIHPLPSTLKRVPFNSSSEQEVALCGGPGEWSYTIKNFFPVLRKINNTIRKHDPILVKTIDAIKNYMGDKDWPGIGKKMNDGTCDADLLLDRNKKHFTIYGMSGNREQKTAENFYSKIWNKLQSDEKAIVLYHRGHLMEDFQVCQPWMIDKNNWLANKGELSWYGRFLKFLPSAKNVTKLIFIDEKFNTKRDRINFAFSMRQNKRYPKQDWAVKLNPFSKVFTEVGFEMFTKDSDMRFWESKYSESQKTLTEIADGLIYNSRAHIKHKNKKSSYYLPKYCK